MLYILFEPVTGAAFYDAEIPQDKALRQLIQTFAAGYRDVTNPADSQQSTLAID